jgi:hypothetical protein
LLLRSQKPIVVHGLLLPDGLPVTSRKYAAQIFYRETRQPLNHQLTAHPSR